MAYSDQFLSRHLFPFISLFNNSRTAITLDFGIRQPDPLPQGNEWPSRRPRMIRRQQIRRIQHISRHPINRRRGQSGVAVGNVLHAQCQRQGIPCFRSGCLAVFHSDVPAETVRKHFVVQRNLLRPQRFDHVRRRGIGAIGGNAWSGGPAHDEYIIELNGRIEDQRGQRIFRRKRIQAVAWRLFDFWR